MNAAAESLRALEACILAHGDVSDCVVRQRVDHAERSVVIAYVDVAARAMAFGSATLPDATVHVTSIPLRGDGGVDDNALLRLPVIDDEIID